MITTIVGLPGGGKSYYAVRTLVTCLIETEKIVITNLPIDRGALAQYLHEKYAFPDDLNNRLRLLDDDEIAEFYRFQTVTGPRNEKPSHAGLYDNPEPIGRDICYLIDEAHIKFDARNWSKIGPDLTFYASQHRKLRHDCYFITQDAAFLESRLRALSQEFHRCRNFANTRFWTYFSLPKKLVVDTFSMPPPKAGAREEAMSRVYYSLDVKLANCYATMSGVGVRGVPKVEQTNKRGLSLIWLLVPALALAFALYFTPTLASKVVTSATETTQKPKLVPEMKEIPQEPKKIEVGELAKVATGTPSQLPERAFIAAKTTSKGETLYYLTDGSILPASHCQIINARYVRTYKGETFYFRWTDRAGRPGAQAPAMLGR